MGLSCGFPRAFCCHGSGGPADAPLSQSLTAAAGKAVIPLVSGQRELAPAQMLPSLSLVRAPSSLRCQACGGGQALDAFPSSLGPSPCTQSTEVISQPLHFHSTQRQMHQSFQGLET